MALTDIECKKQVNLVGTWFEVESAYQKAAIEKDFERFKGFQRRKEQLLVKAAEILVRSTQ